MFVRTEAVANPVTLFVNGTPVVAQEGEPAAAALIAAGIAISRTTAVSDAARGPFCMMGACFDCLARVDGVDGVQLCQTPAIEGMRIETQHGARQWEDAA